MQKRIKSFDNTYVNYDIRRLSNEFLVFVHGGGGDLNAWKEVRQALHKKGISTLAIDLRGHGLSDRPDLITDYKLDNSAKDIYYILKKENIRNFVIIGHCLGGAVTITFHKLHPNLAKAYILIGTTHKAPERLVKLFNNHPLLLRFLNKILTRKKSHKKPRSHVNFDKFIGTGDWNFRRIYSDIIHTSFKSWLFTYEKFASFDGTRILRTIRKPVLIIHGKEDTVFKIPVAKKIKRLVKGSKLNIIPSANHILVINNPKILETEIFNFISKLPNFRKKAR